MQQRRQQQQPDGREHREEELRAERAERDARERQPEPIELEVGKREELKGLLDALGEGDDICLSNLGGDLVEGVDQLDLHGQVQDFQRLAHLGVQLLAAPRAPARPRRGRRPRSARRAARPRRPPAHGPAAT